MNTPDYYMPKVTSKLHIDLNMTNEITELKRKLAEQDEIIRELNERASSHLITMLNTVQKLKLENDMMNAKLRQKNQ